MSRRGSTACSPRWSEQIHDEWMRNLTANAPGLPVNRLHGAKQPLNIALPATFAGHEKHIPAITLPDPDDRHVVAAAIEAKASHILTWRELLPSPCEHFRLHVGKADIILDVGS